jgi:hypothetical protein
VDRCYVLWKHVAIFGQLLLAGCEQEGARSLGEENNRGPLRCARCLLREGRETLSLVVGTILWVSVITVVIAIIGYVLDRRTARQERKE